MERRTVMVVVASVRERSLWHYSTYLKSKFLEKCELKRKLQDARKPRDILHYRSRLERGERKREEGMKMNIYLSLFFSFPLDFSVKTVKCVDKDVLANVSSIYLLDLSP